MNQIIHPLMISRTFEAIQNVLEKDKNAMVVVDAALIIELGLDEEMDYIVTVEAPLDVRIERIRQRDNLSKREIEDRINSQLPLHEKINKADYIISNNGNLIELDREVQSLFRWLKVRSNIDPIIKE